MVAADRRVSALEAQRMQAHERMRRLREDIEIKKACGKGVSAADRREQESLGSLIATLDAALDAATPTGREQHEC
jgi:hypothetical protein